MTEFKEKIFDDLEMPPLPSLKELNLRGCSFREQGDHYAYGPSPTAPAVLFQSCPNLESLNMANNRITPELLLCVGQHCPHIISLNMKEGDFRPEDFSQHLEQNHFENPLFPELKYISVAGSATIRDAVFGFIMPHFPNATHVNINATALRENALAIMSHNGNHLTHVYLPKRGDPFLGQHIIAFANATRSLKFIDFWNLGALENQGPQSFAELRAAVRNEVQIRYDERVWITTCAEMASDMSK